MSRINDNTRDKQFFHTTALRLCDATHNAEREDSCVDSFYRSSNENTVRIHEYAFSTPEELRQALLSVVPKERQAFIPGLVAATFRQKGIYSAEQKQQETTVAEEPSELPPFIYAM